MKYCEHYFPEFIENLSSCKSPQQMFGALAKTWYAQKMGINPKDIFVVGIITCTAKKFEAEREDEDASGYSDMDVALTTRELARMIDRAGIDFVSLPDENFDAPLGTSTGAGAMFGATGGVMEAALRTAREWITGEEAENVDFVEVRGPDGIREAEYQIGSHTIRVAVASGLSDAKELLERVRRGEKVYHSIEIMGCPGGCVNGGGQPIQHASVRNWVDLQRLRAEALYQEDRDLPIRKSNENPVLQEIYVTFLQHPGSQLAHRTLHTTYCKRHRYFNKTAK